MEPFLLVNLTLVHIKAPFDAYMWSSTRTRRHPSAPPRYRAQYVHRPSRGLGESGRKPTPKRQPVFKNIEIPHEAIALRSLPGLIRVESVWQHPVRTRMRDNVVDPPATTREHPVRMPQLLLKG